MRRTNARPYFIRLLEVAMWFETRQKIASLNTSQQWQPECIPVVDVALHDIPE